MAICFFLPLFYLEVYHKNMLICHYYGEIRIDFASKQSVIS